MKKHYHISLGPSFDYFFLGLFIFGVGIWLGSAIHPFGWVLCPAGVIVFLSRKAIDFDTVGMRRKLYYDFVLFDLGGWIPYAEDDEIWLVKSSSYRRASVLHYDSGGIAIQFTIVLSTNTGDMELNIFDEYLPAVRCLEKYSEALNLRAVNDFENDLMEAQSRPRR